MGKSYTLPMRNKAYRFERNVSRLTGRRLRVGKQVIKSLLTLAMFVGTWSGLGAPWRSSLAQGADSQASSPAKDRMLDSDVELAQADIPMPDPEVAPTAEEIVTPEPGVLEPAAAVEDPSAWDEDYWQQAYEPPAPTCTSGTWFMRGKWYARQDFVYMSRYSLDTRRLIADSTLFKPTGEPEDVTTTGRSLGFEPGGRLVLGRFLCRDQKNRDHSIEFQFMGLFDYQISSGMTGRSTNSLFTPIDTFALTNSGVGGFNGTQVQEFTYDSSYDNYELNYVISQRLGRDRLEMTPEGEWVRKLTPSHISTAFVGVRVIDIGEGFLWTSEAADPATNNGRYEVTTQNQLLGLQFGHELSVQRPKFRFSVRNRVAGLINYAEQKSYVHIIDTTGNPDIDETRIQSGSSHDMSFLYDLSVMAAYHLRPNVAIRTGYEFMYLNQLALAPEQLTFAPPPTQSQIVNGGAVIFNGFSLGLEMVW